jgi:ferritin
MNRLLTYVMSIIIICAAAFIVFWFLIEEPFRTATEEKDKAVRETRARIKKLEGLAGEIKEKEKEINDTKQEIFKMLCAAQGRSIEKFLKELEEDADESKIELENIRIESVIIKDLYSKIPLNLNISGPYFKIYDFIKRIQDRGKLDFGTGYLSIQAEAKADPVENLFKYIAKDTKYVVTDTFPNLRVEVNGEMVIIDNTHLERYRTDTLSKCDDAGLAPASGAPAAP